jgi:hypothetical protein
MLPERPMSLTPAYHALLNPKFLEWYLKTFTNTRRGYGHWSVTGYCSPDRAYHREIICVGGVAQSINPAGVALTDDLDGHTSGRNTGSIAICIGSLDSTASTDALGDKPPTLAEIKQFVEETARCCINLHMPVANLMTHAEAANNLDFPTTDDPDIPAPPSYGPGSKDFERWDLHVKMDVKTFKMVPLFDGSVALYPAGRLPHGPINARVTNLGEGWEYFPDWWRGQVALRIQELTKDKWGAAT